MLPKNLGFILGNKWRNYLGIISVIVIFYFLFSFTYKNWNLIRNYPWHFNYYFLLCAFMVLMARHFLMAYIWQKILKNISVSIPFRQSFRIWYLASGGRYLPGRIWYALGMIYLSSEIGIPAKNVLLGGAFNMSLSLISAFLTGLVILPSYLSWDMTAFEKAGCLIAGILSLPLLLCLVQKAVVFISKKRGYNDDFRIAPLLCWVYPFILYIVSWMFYGEGLYFLLIALMPAESVPIFTVISSYAISHTIGFLSMITPGGLAVREGVLTILLSGFLPAYVASAIAVLTRVIFTLAEIASFLIALLIKRESIPKQNEKNIHCACDS